VPVSRLYARLRGFHMGKLPLCEEGQEPSRLRCSHGMAPADRLLSREANVTFLSRILVAPSTWHGGECCVVISSQGQPGLLGYFSNPLGKVPERTVALCPCGAQMSTPTLGGGRSLLPIGAALRYAS
jgi:hypothetical protein